MMQSMVIQMNDRQLRTLAQLQFFLDGTAAVDFAVAAEERYGFIGRTVRRFTYGRLKRTEKAVVLRFLERVSGYSRQQFTRLVKRGAERAPLVKRYRGSRTELCQPLHLSRRAAAGAHRFAARDAFGTCHQEAHGAGLPALWRFAL
jgi:hypothetical protein